MKYFPQIFSTLLILLTIFAPEAASAQGFLPCDGSPSNPCNSCDIAVVANNLISWLIGAIMVLFAVLMVTAGFGLVTAQGNPDALNTAKSRFTNAIVGFIIVLSAWLIVDTLMRGLLAGSDDTEVSGYLAWSEIQCTTQTVSGVDPDEVMLETFWVGDPNSPANNAEVIATRSCIEYVSGMFDCGQAKTECPNDSVPVENGGYVNCLSSGQTPATFSGTVASDCGSSSCVPLTIPCKSGANCSISPDMVSNLAGMHNLANVNGARVTEGFPPTREHKSKCHYNGTCVDYSKAGGMTAAEVKAVSDAALANGLRPIYEVTSESRRQELISAGVPAANVKNLGSWISAEHFSIYGY